MKERSSVLDGIPVQLPALMQAAKIQTKASRVGFDWGQVDGAFTKVTEELKELSTAIEHQQQAEMEEEIGDLLFAVVNVARFLQVDPEVALLRTVRKFKQRFSYIEAAANRRGIDLKQMTLAEMDKYWEEAKRKQ